MTPIEKIYDLAQDVYLTVNGSENDDTGEDKIIFEDNFIRSFNLWLDEYESETYWNEVYESDYVLGTIADTITYSFALPDAYRTPVIDENKYLKFVNDGTVIAKFKLVNPDQRVVDDGEFHPDRATFVGRHIVLSRAPKPEELGSEMVLDVVQYFPKLSRTNSDSIDLIYSKQIAVLGIAKNISLSDVTKVSLSPSFAQKYASELQKALMANAASNEIDLMRRDNFGYIGGIW